MKKHLPSLALSLYVGIAIITFGHSFERRMVNEKDEPRLAGALLSSVAWPLYWSAECWKR